ncbi:MAG: OB-fold nucleic acid binding domain-containing protein, partial [Armatimonadota bacterium]|nr:OB-fold nucleic acid binding domain-containing protein [Armatimonadota bacterium]
MSETAAVVPVASLRDHVGQTVEVRGWLYNRRSSGRIHFLLVRDGTGIVQAVMSKADVPDEAFAAAERLPQESSLTLQGVVRADARAPGGVEISVSGLRVV